TVTLRNLSHTWASDIDVLLVGPGGQGQKALVLSDAGDAFAPNNVTVTLSDAATSALPSSGSFVSGTYKPTDYTDSSPGGDNFPAPAPVGPYAGALSAFNGTAPNGAWSLYVFDDGPGDSGSFAGGWSLTVTTISATSQTPVINWTNPAPITYGTPLNGTQLDATASVAGTFVYSPPAGTVLNAGNGQVLSTIFTPTDTQNYTSATNTISIDVQKSPLTVAANNTNKTYGDTVTFTGTQFSTGGLINGDTVTNVTLTSAGVAGTVPVSGSPYSIVPSAAAGMGLNNYSITYSNGMLTVNQKAASLTANNTNKTYGDTVTFTGTEFSASGLINGDTVTNVTLTSAGAAAVATVSGSPYAVVPSAAMGNGLDNYNIDYTNGTHTVNPAVLVIRGKDASRAYGMTNPVFSVSYTGFVNGEDSNALGGVLVIDSPASTNSVAGTYPIIPSGLTSTNYAITFSNGILTVIPANTPPTLAPISNLVLNAGQILSFTNFASDTDVPPQTLTFSLLNFPSGATLDPTSGVFIWRPAVVQAATTNLIQLSVSDNGSPVMSATQSFTATVNTLTPPSVTPMDVTNNQLKLLITGDAGPDYTLQSSTDFTTWSNLFTTNSPVPPFTWTFTNTDGFSQQFFRIMLGP
ncbi:MAG: MBG-2 domain-containing protein, partial [Verrucomicrobia bacterium]|nr:MBG-2 domain-containing protein [Verrucomicrobiota bacterium]